jgi:2-hydroxychromene-2-carboxylate isomerase
MVATVEFFYDFSCPFAYLGSTQIERVCADAGAMLIWRPFHLGGLFRELYGADARPPTPIAPKAFHNAQDLRRWASQWKVPLSYPAAHPIRTADALRAVIAAPESAAELTHRFYKAYWVDHLDLGDRAVLRTLLEEAGVDAEAVMKSVASPDVRQRLRKATDEAQARGVFGAPTCFVDREFMVWGQDRLDFVRAAAEGWRPEEPND